MSSTSITVHNLNEYLEYEIIYESQRVIISWDINNDDIGSLMSDENSLLYNNNDKYKNLMWVDEIKKAVNWEEGKRIIISIIKYKSAMIIYTPKLTLMQVSYLVIDEDGYLLLKKSDNSRVQIFERCNGLYNDLLDITNSHILK